MTGVRQARRAEIKQTLSQYAIKLFLKNGFDQTTVDEIVELAGVSRRTFFRHFDTKEDLVFVWYEDLGHEIVAECLARPQDEAPFASACAALRSLLKYYESDPAWADSMMKLSTATPGLIAKGLEKRLLWEAGLAEALAPRFAGADADLKARLAASAAVQSFALAVAFWFDGKSAVALHDTVDAAFSFASKLDVSSG